MSFIDTIKSAAQQKTAERIHQLNAEIERAQARVVELRRRRDQMLDQLDHSAALLALVVVGEISPDEAGFEPADSLDQELDDSVEQHRRRLAQQRQRAEIAISHSQRLVEDASSDLPPFADMQ